ncbi:MAG: putative signal transducing protein [Bacteroidota bacterium]
MNEELVCVYITGKDYLSTLLRQILTDNDIESYAINKQDSSYQFGDIEVYVHRDDVIRAKRIIAEFEAT